MKIIACDKINEGRTFLIVYMIYNDLLKQKINIKQWADSIWIYIWIKKEGEQSAKASSQCVKMYVAFVGSNVVSIVYVVTT